MSATLSLLSGLTVLLGFWSHRPGPRRVLELIPPRSVSRSRRLGAWRAPFWRARRRRAGERAAVARALPEAVDLFAVAVGAGLTVPLAVAAVAERVDGVFGAALRRSAAAIAAGQRCADALDDAADDLGPDARPLLDALRASEHYGAPLADALVRISAEVRADRRRRAEEAARRVPVKLLFPLVLCVLPAFALLTVAPLLAGTLGSLRL